MIIPVPDVTFLVEYNHVHSPADGRFATSAGGSGAEKRQTPIVAKNVSEAVAGILAGKVVVLHDTRSVNTILTKLAAMAQQAEKLGKKAPNYNLCKVSVAGTNLFCAAGLKTKEFPDGVPRIKMPQLGKDIGDFRQYLRKRGIDSKREFVNAASLKATQNELVGPKVAAFMVDKTLTAHKRKDAIFISSDNYVVDGHHRWAALVGRDAKDNKLGNLKMATVRINAPISELLHIGNKYAKKRGYSAAAGL